ncbi:MAG: hypothetical protein A2758_01945 [Candidatus Zambryskibacteria bacterium RIFCSPHIGHO2_01_FULL_49_18]|uniref:DNA polymerase III delta N-terminal domain-containing protein n=2 Tax=Candidatus Zambryskiibacteriota TaxID=1817925 RepID=A0A1G2T1V4_9BACT|nr:MAG: hypothetical protein A2758_01945 [Candidatus Zambryskibacteria bacterium RIFCSPHIGHO2_01_FULL_49_18]OHB05107.1 MAG: hypothetical protein A3A26_00680 [Candidatus Zambryskibacteria bacterium RIFCSPLOWO2_01_FULL_47_14]
MHHAYLLVGEREAAERYLYELCKYQGLTLIGSPDYFIFNEALFGIDEARRLGEQAARKAFVERKIFFITPEKITLEAQNALLKTFEDPVEDTHFFLAVREEGLIIPTLRSRMVTWRLDRQVAVQPFEFEAQNFLKLPLKDRFEFVRKFVEKEKNLSVFLDELLCVTKSKEVYKMRLYSDDRAISARLILEHLALVL